MFKLTDSTNSVTTPRRLIGIGLRELVAVFAVGLCSLLCGANYGNQPAPHVLGLSDGFNVTRVNAAPDAAQMVKDEAFGYRPTMKLKGNDVGLALPLGVIPHLPIPVGVAFPHPDPATAFSDGNDFCEKPPKRGDSSILFLSHVILLGSHRLGLRSADNGVAARFNFTPDRA